MKPHIVIVGGVAAGPKMAAKARRQDPDVPITLVTDEVHISYAACGTPYFLGHVFTDPSELLVRTADDFGAKTDVTVLTGHRATAVDAAAHTVTVVDRATGREQVLEYSKLGLATGARPFVPPLEGGDAEGVFTLRSVTDAEAIEAYLDDYNVRHVVVAGAGFIGVEVVENLRLRGIDVTLVELASQVLPPVDAVVARAAAQELERLGAEVLLETKVESCEADHRGRLTAVRTTRGPISTQMLLIGVGVRPNAELAKAAGLRIGETGAIWVDSRMRTSDPDIYAAGDCAEQTHLVSGRPTWIPLGSTANKQARVAAVNMTGGDEGFPGVAGTALVRIGELNIGLTGLGERELGRLGVDYESCIVPQADKPGYMPDSAQIILILHAETASRRVVGAQCYGPGEVSKRIDVLATAITAGMTVDQVANLDLGYAPPFAPAMDVVLTAANVLRSKLDKATEGVMPHVLAARNGGAGTVLVDCREVDEWNQCRIPGARLVPLSTIAQRAGELKGNEQVVVYCKGGLRSVTAYRRLKQAGVEQVCYLDGGLTTWCGEVER